MNLPTCPQCGKSHLPVATRCPHCGHAFPREPFEERDFGPASPGASRVWIGVGVLAVIGVGAWAALTLAPPTSPPPAAVSGPPARPAPAPEPAAATPPAAEVPLPQPPVRSVTPRTAAPAPAGPAVPSNPPGLLTRWTINWANVREAAALDAPIVTVLRPGTEILVGERVAGFVRLYRDGQPVGYVAGSLVGTAPPDSLP